MEKFALLPGDTIGIIAPSRPIDNIEKEISAGIFELKRLGFKTRRGANINKKLYYSAGFPEEKVADIHEMFLDPEIKAIICATGGSSANQIVDLIDFQSVKNSPKIFMGYSDITVLLLSLYKKAGTPVFYGPTIYEIPMLTEASKKFLLKILDGKEGYFKYPNEMEIIRSGMANGKLVGGLLSRINSLLGTDNAPDFEGAILFWEEVNMSPAMLDFNLQILKLNGVFEKIAGMIVGKLTGCIDSKHPEDNRSIKEIILERTEGFNFPIIQVDYFGHEVSDFRVLPIGADAKIDTEERNFSITL